MLIKKQYRETPGVPKSLWEMGESFFVILKIVPSSVSSFVRNIKGNKPGRTELKKSCKPLIVEDEKSSGFEIISIIIKIMRLEKNRPEKFCLMLKIKNFDFLREIVFVIVKYMLKCLYKLEVLYGKSKEVFSWLLWWSNN